VRNIREFIALVKRLYKENDFPSDPLIRDPRALEGFTAELGVRAGQDFSPEDVAAELIRIRKDKKRTGGLPALGRSFHGPRWKSRSKTRN